MAHRLDAGRVVAVIPEPAAQTGDGHVHAAILAVVVAPPQAAKQRLPPQDLAGVAGQLPQEVEIGGGEGNALPIEAHIPTRAVYLEAAELQALGRGGGDHGLLALPLLAKLDSQPGQQHRGGRGLEDVVVGPQLQAQDLVHVAVERSEHDDGAGKARAQIPAQGEAILPRQHDVEQHQIRLLGQGPVECPVTPGLQQHLDVVATEPTADELAYLGIVFNKQNAWHGGVVPRSWREWVCRQHNGCVRALHRDN